MNQGFRTIRQIAAESGRPYPIVLRLIRDAMPGLRKAGTAYVVPPERVGAALAIVNAYPYRSAADVSRARQQARELATA